MKQNKHGTRIDFTSVGRDYLASLSELRGLSQVEKLIVQAFASEERVLEEIPRHLFSLGGKRIRPVLALMTAQAFGMAEPSNGLIETAAGIELIHMASLLHDDIIDSSIKRRNDDTAFKRYGLPNSLLAGDFLFVKAFGLCTRLDPCIIEETEQACVALTEGEVMDGSPCRGNPVEYSLEIARKKTAALFALACFCGAFAAAKDKGTAQKMRSFGENLGVSFQIIDDILDISAEEINFGKPCGMDLKTRRFSVVNALWIKSGSVAARRFFESSDPGPEAIEEAICEIKKAKIPEQALKIARLYASQAGELLKLACEGEGQSFDPNFQDLTALVESLCSRIS